MPFTIVRDDLTRMSVDAIVNTANPRPVIGSGTDSAVYKAAGAEKLIKERLKIGDIPRGEAAITGAYSLPSKYIIHTVGPIWQGGFSGEEELLRSCYRNSLNLALKKKCKSIAFPLISTGNYRFPKDLALRIVVDTVSSFLEDHDMMIYLVVFGADSTRLSEKLYADIEQRITDEDAEKLEEAEYSAAYFSSNISEDYEYESPHFLYDAMPSAERRSRQREDSDFMPFADKSSSPEPKPTLSAKSVKPSKRSLEKLLKQQNETFSEMLLRLISEKGMTNAQAYKKANQDKRSFSKIKNNKNSQPQKKTVLAYVLALELSMDEAKDLLARAGYAFSPSSNLDKVIQYCIEEKFYNIFDVEIILYDLGLETLCNP
ncbi:MAG: macro domain-containing protein [Lachnospiraceae bacterium]|nr:macro domain-containing protein [Lachnospiraceae bacterium]